MADQDVTLLNAGRLPRRNRQAIVGHAPELSTGLPGQSGGNQAVLPGRFEPFPHAFGIAAGRNSDSNVARSGEGFDLARKDQIVAVIVTNCRDTRGVHGEREGGKRRAVEGKTAYKFGRDVLGIRGAAAVSEQNRFVPVSDCFDQKATQLT